MQEIEMRRFIPANGVHHVLITALTTELPMRDFAP